MIEYKVFGENLKRMESRELGLYRKHIRETTENVLEREERLQMIDNEIRGRLMDYMDSWIRDPDMLCPRFSYEEEGE